MWNLCNENFKLFETKICLQLRRTTGLPPYAFGVRCRQNFLSEKQHNIFFMASGLTDYKFLKNLTAHSVKDNGSTFQIVLKSAVKHWLQKLGYRPTIYTDQGLDKQRNFMQTLVCFKM